MEKQLSRGLTSTTLHILAMAFMLCDHLWAIVLSDWQFLTCIGRIAFPIFAFMIAEGCYHTSDLKKYMGRMLVFALISEIPFNLFVSGRLFYPVHQNVLWTFLIAMCLIWISEKARAKNRVLFALSVVLCLVLGFVLGLVTMCDYYFGGIYTVLLFWFFRGRKWWQLAAQAVGLWYINTEIIGGFGWDISFFGTTFFVQLQAFAMLALVFIWLYNGQKGSRSRAMKYGFYLFYPVHMLILSLAYFV